MPNANAAPDAGPSALIIGEALIDVVHDADGTVAEHPGGSPANVAIALARLERNAHLLTWIGEDAYGTMIKRWLSASRVNLLPESASAASTSIATAHLDETGRADYAFEIEWRLAQFEDPGDVCVVHSGSLATSVEPGASAVSDLLRTARKDATITYDPNVRPALLGQALSAAPKIEQLVMLADVVKVSDEDLAWLYPHRAPAKSAALWHKRSGAIVVLTRGAQGAQAWSKQGQISVPGIEVEVVDTVGAGDATMGALIDGLWEANLLGAARRRELRECPLEVLEPVLRRAVTAGAITVSRAGANPPKSAELDRYQV